MLQYLKTGKTYTLLQSHCRTNISKFVHHVCQAICDEFQKEYLCSITDSKGWKKVEEKFRIKWNVRHAVATVDGNHITIKKPKKSGSDYYNYKGFFSLVVVLALVDTEYRFLWFNVGSSGSSSDF